MANNPDHSAKPTDPNLASGFARVDSTPAPDQFSACLRSVNGLDSTTRYKRRSYELLDLKPGLSVLDAGCGLGEDVFQIAALVSPGLVTGVDSSQRMIEIARSDSRARTVNAKFRAGDLTTLPFPDNFFDRVRVDRVLQHISDAEKAISELVRVLKPTGILVGVEPDWGTFTIDSADCLITRKVLDLWCDSFQNGWAGRKLYAQFRRQGLEQVQIEQDVLIINDFSVADTIYTIRESVQRASALALITARQGEEWLREISGPNFHSTLARFLVSGKKAE